MTYDKDHAQETFRLAVLAALDEAAAKVFGVEHNGLAGAADADLPELFKGIDAQVQRLSIRYNHPLYEGYIGSERYQRERAQLRHLGLPVADDDALHA